MNGVCGSVEWKLLHLQRVDPPPQLRRIAMPEIAATNGVVTQITTVSVPPDNQDEALRLMKERARFMAKQPGFVSISLHRSTDGGQIVNYIQWKNREQLEAAH